MKELMERLIGLGEEFDVMGRVKEGVRDWSGMVGIKKEEDEEEFIRRVVLGNSLNFNYLEEGIKGLSSNNLWEWVREGMYVEGLNKFNLVELRKEMYMRCWYFVNYVYSIGGNLKEEVKREMFWLKLWEVYGEDVCWKRVNLVRMMLKESGVEIWDKDKVNVVVDYNLMCVFKYLGVINYEGDFKDKKEGVNLNRMIVYEWVIGLIEVSGKDESWLDGLMFFVGRKLREKGLVNVCLYNGCIDY